MKFIRDSLIGNNHKFYLIIQNILAISTYYILLFLINSYFLSKKIHSYNFIFVI